MSAGGASPAGGRVPRSHWIAVGAAAVSVVLASASLAGQPPAERVGTVVFSYSGALGHACPTPGVYCSWLNFTTPGANGEFRQIEFSLLFNASCRTACYYEIESDVADSTPSEHHQWGVAGLVNWSATWDGELPSGPAWILVTEDSLCPTDGCVPFPLGAVIAVYDQGIASGPPPP